MTWPTAPPSPRRLRVMLVHRDLHQVTRGGICTVYRALASELAARGHQIILVTQQSQDPPPEQVRTNGGASVSVLTLPRTDGSAGALGGHGRAVAYELGDYVATAWAPRHGLGDRLPGWCR